MVNSTLNIHSPQLLLTTHFVHADFGHTVFETIKITLVSVRSIGRTVASTS